MEFISHFGLFLLETLTIVSAVLILFAGLVSISQKHKKKPGKLEVKILNNHYEKLKKTLENNVLDKKLRKNSDKAHKKLLKETPLVQRHKLYVLRFEGDIKASEINGLRESITAILQVATSNDEVLLNLESPGGMVSNYGLAASQLNRLKDNNIRLTVCVDRVAASGGYLMACVADKILAAPFAIIGSVGVVAQLPNFHNLLKKNNIDFEQVTAGKFKRTLTLFGENTDEARLKFKEDLELIHDQFKNFINNHRPKVDIEKISTGEHWLAEKALELDLVDELKTSDDYLLSQAKSKHVIMLNFITKQGVINRISHSIRAQLKEFQTYFTG